MTATVKGGFFAQYGTTLSTAHTRSALRRQAAMALSRRGTLDLQELMLTLDGAAAGNAALKQITRIENNTELGGRRAYETVSLVNRVSVAGDITDINTDVLTHNSYDGSPVANLDGNAAIMGIAH